MLNSPWLKIGPCMRQLWHWLKPDRYVVGGGAVEAALSIYLENFANTLGSREQLAIAEFADALLVIPKTLAVNAAKDATELVAKLRAYHYTAQVHPYAIHVTCASLPSGSPNTWASYERLTDTA